MKHYTPEQRRQYVEQWKSSGLSAKVFAKQNGMAMSSLNKWAQDRRAEAFAPVIICEPTKKAGVAPTPIAEIVVDGLSLRLFSGIASSDAIALMRAARESRA